MRMQGLSQLISNPVIQDGVAGLACTATAFASIEVCLLGTSGEQLHASA